MSCLRRMFVSQTTASVQVISVFFPIRICKTRDVPLKAYCELCIAKASNQSLWMDCSDSFFSALSTSLAGTWS